MSRAILYAVLAAWTLGGAAQPMFKCTDAQKRITYSNTTCDKLGLKDLGTVEDRTMTMPLTPPAQKPAAPPEAAKPAAPLEKLTK